jgi:hypothetical protein
MSIEQENDQAPETLRTRIRNLKTLWNEISRPITLPVSIVLWILAFHKYLVGMGNISYPVLGLGTAAALTLLMSAGSPRLFALRIIGFCIDVGLLAVVTVVGLNVYRTRYGAPSEMIITLVVWVWFFYFVFFDWHLSGTVGKRLFGLKLVSRRNKLTVLRSFIRTFLSTAAPVIVAARLGNALIVLGSRNSFLAGFGLREAILLVNPISILVLGGHQGVVDRITKTEIVYEHRKGDVKHQPVSLRNWALVCLVPLVFGLALSTIAYIGVGGSSFSWDNKLTPISIPPKPSGNGMIAVWSWQDPETNSALWATLPLGIRNPADVIESINIQTLSRNPFKGEDTNVFLYPEDIRTLQQVEGLPVLRISLAPLTSPAVYGVIVQNLAGYEAQSIAPNQRRLTVIKFQHVDDYGFFAVREVQYTLLGVQRTDSSVIWNFTDLKPRGEIGIQVGLDSGQLALLGDGATRELAKDQIAF